MTTPNCEAKPLDQGVAEALDALAGLRPLIVKSASLNDEQFRLIEQAADSPNDVVVAVAALFMQTLDDRRSRELLHKLEAQSSTQGLLTAAVLQTGQAEQELAQSKKSDRIARWQKLLSEANLYTRIEAAKALRWLDPDTAMAALLHLENEKSEISPVANRIRGELAGELREKQPSVYPDIESAYAAFERSAGSLALNRFISQVENQGVPKKRTSNLHRDQRLDSLPASGSVTQTPRTGGPASSTPWSIIVVLILAAIGLLWLLVKKRK